MQDEPLRIAMISEHASPLAALGGTDAGGQNVYVAKVSEKLARAGHHVDVLTRRDAAALPAVVDVAPGFRVLHIDAGPAHPVRKEALLPHMNAFAAAAQRALDGPIDGATPARGGAAARARTSHDLVHANFFMSGLVGLKLRERPGPSVAPLAARVPLVARAPLAPRVPLVMTFHALGLVRREHQGASDAFPPERIDIERRLVRHAERLIAECPQDRSDLLRLYGADPARIATVPCGVDLSEFNPGSRSQARRALGLCDDEFIVLQLGRMVPRKGIDNVIRAVARMACAGTAASASHARPVRLVVVGGESAEPDERITPEIARLRAIARECGIEARVVFTGQRQRAALRQCYLAADVFVSTPWYEPFGITPLEAMACARPVVGSAVGGIQHSVVDGVTGHLVAPNDPDALARRLQELRADPGRAEALGRAGARRVRERFTWERVAGELAEVYAQVRDEARFAARRAGDAGATRLRAPRLLPVPMPALVSARPASPVTVGALDGLLV